MKYIFLSILIMTLTCGKNIEIDNKMLQDMIEFRGVAIEKYRISKIGVEISTSGTFCFTLPGTLIDTLDNSNRIKRADSDILFVQSNYKSISKISRITVVYGEKIVFLSFVLADFKKTKTL